MVPKPNDNFASGESGCIIFERFLPVLECRCASLIRGILSVSAFAWESFAFLVS